MKKWQRVLLAVLASIAIGFFGLLISTIILAVSFKDAPPFLLAFLIWGAVIAAAIYAGVVIGRGKKPPKEKKEKPVTARRVPELRGQLQLVGGLGNLPAGATCSARCADTELSFTSAGQEFVLGVDKLIDVSVMTTAELKSQYVSSVGGAVAGAVLLGPIGAIIGGRATQKTTRTFSKYLVVAYSSEGGAQHIVFDVTGNIALGHQIQNKYRYLKSGEKIRVDL